MAVSCLSEFFESSLPCTQASPDELWLARWAPAAWAETSGSCRARAAGQTEGGRRPEDAERMRGGCRKEQKVANAGGAAADPRNRDPPCRAPAPCLVVPSSSEPKVRPRGLKPDSWTPPLAPTHSPDSGHGWSGRASQTSNRGRKEAVSGFGEKKKMLHHPDAVEKTAMLRSVRVYGVRRDACQRRGEACSGSTEATPSREILILQP